MNTQEYLDSVRKRHKSGISREHAYRGDLESLIRGIAGNVELTNEPSISTDCGNPDFVITKKNIPIGYIEAKDVGSDLDKKQYSGQFTRYRNALDNLIITDYLEFRFYREGKLVEKISIGQLNTKGKIEFLSKNIDLFENLIREFCSFIGETITTSKKLAEMMAGKARFLQDILEKVIQSDEDSEANTSLKDQYKSFKKILIHKLKPEEFADIYAQTLAYGMFAARLHDPTLENFTRQEACELIPKTNPFLRKLFGYVAGPEIDERIKITVDNLADVFRATNVSALIENFNKTTHADDPMVHFYETFLSKYDPKLRKSRGVWYTPEPVVKFIVRAVDEVLKTHFNLDKGLADTAKTDIRIPDDDGKKMKKKVHKVQILDPAVGTGTFLSEVIKTIYRDNFKHQQGAWSGYVEEHLIPRVNGFEILMASYAMAHLKLDMLLTETGYKPLKSARRLNIYLTNSLEKYHPDTGTLFASWLAKEANEANHIKRDTPVMVVMGNPPYSVSTQNKGEWITELISIYKRDLNEKKINLDDDYIKFIRYGQHLIEKNGEGILAYISNNSFLDGVTHRQMRKTLLKTFDDIYIMNLHGSSRKREVCPDGSRDENVFDITQGVCVGIFIKSHSSGRSKQNNCIKYVDLYGSRVSKYLSLLDEENTLSNTKFEKISCTKPYFFFVPKNFESIEEYNNGIKISEFFIHGTSGVESAKDDLIVRFSEPEINKLMDDLDSMDISEISIKYDTKPDKVRQVLDDIGNARITKLVYRPFDCRKTLYSQNSQGVLWRPRYSVMKHMTHNNIALLTCKRQTSSKFRHVFISKYVSERCIVSLQTGELAYTYPLYLYPDPDERSFNQDENSRTPNLNMEIISSMEDRLKLRFMPEKQNDKGTFAPIDILDYIYAILHSPTYRDRHSEFLKIDFPRIPYPKNCDTFWRLVELGSKLRQIHLFESPELNKLITGYPNDGDNKITRRLSKRDPGWQFTDKKKGIGKVWINDNQYFDNVPLTAWEFFIGGYQPAQKWLKDRRGLTLSFEDIEHYQKVIVALMLTDRLMKGIDRIEFMS